MKHLSMEQILERIYLSEQFDEMRITRDQVHEMFREHLLFSHTPELGRKVNAIHDAFIQRTIELAEHILEDEGFGKPPVPYAFILFGSGGRSEQTLWSDQDNGLVYAESEKHQEEEVEEYFIKLVDCILQGLDALGYPPCEGNVVSSNKQWRKPLTGYTLMLPNAVILALVNFMSRTRSKNSINGYGERCGNANLSSIIPNLQLKLGYEVISPEQLKTLTPVSRYISEIANMHMPINQPYVGNAAFAHKGGIHVSAILKDASTYEHTKPEFVGNKQRVLVSELAGQSNVLVKAQELNLDFDKEHQKTKEVIEKIKDLEHQGYQFEGADATLELLLREAFEGLEEIFTLESFKMLVEKSANQSVVSEAIVKVKVHGETIYTAAEGNGPVNALDNALRKALIQYYPDIKNIHLSDYKVRVLDEKDATAGKVRVLMETTDFNTTWNTLGVSSNIIEASWYALVDSLRYALISRQRVEPANKEQNERLGLINH